VGNAPCSWGTLEFEGIQGEQIGFSRMLDELAEAGYTGTELGDWGYMPTDPATLSSELRRRGLVMLGAFVPVALENRGCHKAGVESAVRTARLLRGVRGEAEPFLVLAANNGSDAIRTRNAGRVTPEMGLSDPQWRIFADGANSIARTVLAETGLRTVFHHHCAGYVETPDEIERLLSLTDERALGLVFDTGHYTYGSGKNSVDLAGSLDRFRNRIWYVHLKDCEPSVATAAREHGWDYFEAVRRGVFCELGKGCVDFPAVLRWLRSVEYDGYVLVEQDVLPGMGAPAESARRNREYLRRIDGNYA
jgi:inosose dehydratase